MSYILRPYQQDLAEAVWTKTQQHERNVLIVLPTGGGKTKLGAKLSDLWCSTGSLTWIFAHRRELIHSWSADLTALGCDHGIIAPDNRLTNHRLQVCSIDTVMARLGELSGRLAMVRRILDDECHHAVSESRARVHAIAKDALKIGVTATPYRLDGAGLGNVYNDAVVGPTMRALIAMGSLSPFIVYEPPLVLDFSQARKSGGDYAKADLEKIVDQEPVTSTAIAAYRRYLHKQPTIIFCATVRHAERVALAFKAAGYRAASIDGNSKDRDQLIMALATNGLDVLTSCDVISEGTDVPVAMGAILLRKTASTGLLQQQCGRVLRLAPGKLRAVIIDLVKNIEAHGMPDAIRKWTLAGGIKGLEKQVAPTRRCRSCFCRTEAGPPLCPNCGATYAVAVRPSSIIGMRPAASAEPTLALPGLTDSQILTMEMPAIHKVANTKAELVRVAKVRGYGAAWPEKILMQRKLRARGAA